MPNLKELDDLSVFGVDKETYSELFEIAKKQGKSVVDVASDALKSHIEKNKPLEESKKKKLLVEG
jgi:hypothetical protein